MAYLILWFIGIVLAVAWAFTPGSRHGLCLALFVLVSTSACVSPVAPEPYALRGACADKAIAYMPTDEYRALQDGLEAARRDVPALTLREFFVQQAVLYHTAQEGDARLRTFFYGDTLNLFYACMQ